MEKIKRKRNGSISMFIEQHIEHSNIWIDDRDILNCDKCKSSFSFLNRKHHCRNCGRIFCGYCSNNWIKIPNQDKYINKYWNIRSYIHTSDKQRVCHKCYIKIDELNEYINIIDFFDLLELSIEDYINLSRVCKSWNKVANYYFSYFKEIQYYLPNHEYTQKDINVLKNNMDFISGHSRWIIQLIRIEKYIDKNHLLNVLHIPKDTSCLHIMCGKICNKQLQLQDIIVCLYNDISNICIFKYLIECLYNYPSDNLIFYISFIVFKLRDFIKKQDYLDLLLNLLFDISKESIYISNTIFWELTPYIDVSDQIYKDFYICIRKRFVKKLNRNVHVSFSKIYDFTNVLVDIVNKSEHINVDIHKYLTKINGHFKLPISIKKEYVTILTNKIKEIESKTKPVMIPCINIDTTTDLYIIKKEDIRKENISMAINLRHLDKVLLSRNY